MKKTLIALLALGMASTTFASFDSYYPNEYRADFEKLISKDDVLKSELFTVLSSFHQKTLGQADTLTKRCEIEKNPKSADACYQQISLGYKEARRQLFGYLHLKSDDQGIYLEDKYCGGKKREKDFGSDEPIGELKIPNANVVNCEHSWPQSHFTGKHSKGMQKADLHHLFPTDSKANSTRGNNPFGEVSGNYVNSGCKDSKIGHLEYIPYSSAGGTYFEPPKEHRGNLARALFYFSVRYQTPIERTEEYFLKKWHKEDPVDENEMERNNRIEGLQYNRNPFIDFPELVDNISDF